MFLKKIFGRKPSNEDLPWIEEGKKVFGLHEGRNKAELTAWLKSDGRRLGDTEELPWCGDYVETAIRNSLPDEPLPGDLGKNPYWARNWLLFGRDVTSNIPLGAILVFKRGNGGHVCFAVGEDNGYYYCLGGNQSNTVNITRIAKNRLLGARWPATYKGKTTSLPSMKSDSIPVSTNEF